ncbi:uncharacterized protein LOC112494431 isoform X1 [Cephus cinctus]|uniref:Uncharacterized protein LOC112494431 isoform X1 n=2 Tax=Cephus cinctus TaxID=211228 RepID=A0AAJ7W299_CEPCN|nr:uncharacterized protein LOC112494431 isoform X1 [Cephus cinctus]
MNGFRENPLFFFMDDNYGTMPEECNGVGKIIEISDVGCDARTPRSSWQKIVDKSHSSNFPKRENSGDNQLGNMERIGDYSRKEKNRVKVDLLKNEKMSMNDNYEDFEIIPDTKISEKSKNVEGRFKDLSSGRNEKSQASYKKFGNSNQKSTRGFDDFKRNEISEIKENLIKSKKRIPINRKETLNRKNARELENIGLDKVEQFITAKENSDLLLFYDKIMHNGVATCADSLSNLSKHSNPSDISVKSRLSNGSRISKISTISRNSTKFFDNYFKKHTTTATKDSAVSKESDLISNHVDFDSKGKLKKSESDISTNDSSDLTAEEISTRRTRTKDILEPKCKYLRRDDWQSYPYQSKDLEPTQGNRLLVERGESPINLGIETSFMPLRTKDVTKISRGQSPIRFPDIRSVSRNQNSGTKSFFSWGKHQGNGNSVSLKSTSGKSVSALRKKVSEIPRPVKTKIGERKKELNSNKKTMLERIQQNRRSKTEFSPKIIQKAESSTGAKIKTDKSQEHSSRKNPNLKSRSFDTSTREVDTSIERIEWAEKKKMEISSLKSNIAKKHDETEVPIRIRQGKNMVLENPKKSKIPAAVPRENTKSDRSVKNNTEISENVENLEKTKSAKIDVKTKIYNQDKPVNVEFDVSPMMERNTTESINFTPKSKIPTYNTLDKVHQNNNELKIKNEYTSENQSKSKLWSSEYEEAFLKGRSVGMKVIKMAKAARDDRKRVYVNHGFDDYKKRPRDTSEEILDIGMTVIENVLHSPEEYLSARTSDETLEDYPMYESAHDWSPRNSNETFWFI